MSKIDDTLDDYETAASIRATDFSHLGIDDFANVEIDNEGNAYGIVMDVPIKINDKPKEQDGSLIRDIGRGLTIGARDAGKALGDTLPLLGTPVDLVNEGLREVGDLIGVDLASDKPFLGSDMIRDGVTAVLEFGDDLIPKGANEAFVEYVNEPPNSKILQSIFQIASEMGVQAVTPAMYLRAFTVMSPLARGLAWGGIADFINSQPDDEGAISAVTKMLSGATPEERGAFANAVMMVVEKQESDPEIISKARDSLDGMIIGGALEKIVEGAVLGVKYAKNVNTDDLRERIVQAGARADERLGSVMRGETLSANPIGAVGDMALSAAGKLAKRSQMEIATDLNPQGFFSAVSRAVDAIPMEKGSGAQMRAMIAKGEGVKAEEMAWIGLDDFLAGKKSVTKQEVRDYVDANQVQVEEVVLPAKKDLTAESTENYRNNLEEMSDEQLAKESADEFGIDENDALDAIKDGDREAYIDDLMVEYERFLGQGGGLDVRSTGVAKFGEYTLPGGENYREVLLTLPEQPVTRARYAIKGADGNNVASNATTRNEAIAEAGGDASRVVEIRDKNTVNPNFTGSHYDEPNVLAHIRLNDRTGPNGERILFIEEIQSDWHQKGRKEGYGDAGVPDAPLKKTWHEMSWRRVARMAAEEGYDAIAWTPGKVQAERYDLSKQISRVYYSDGTLYADDLNGRTVVDETVEPEGFDQYIGKEVADKLRERIARREYDRNEWSTEYSAEDGGWLIYDPNGEPKYGYGGDLEILGSKEQANDEIDRLFAGEAERQGGEAVVEGLDIKVGGEGMKGFYDQMLKKYAEKWGKKFGSKVGVTKIEAGAPADTEVWTMPVTPKMRDTVLKKGVPLFSAAGATAATGAAMQNDNQPASERVF